MRSTPKSNFLYIGRARLLWKKNKVILVRFEREDLLEQKGRINNNDEGVGENSFAPKTTGGAKKNGIGEYKYDPIADSECMKKVCKNADEFDMKMLEVLRGTLYQFYINDK
jgi:hypothetical protein